MAEQEPGVDEMAGNVDTNGGNLNVPAAEDNELAATKAKLETTLDATLDATLETGERAALETGMARFSARTATKDSQDCWSAWATATAISLGREFEVPKATDKTATESPED